MCKVIWKVLGNGGTLCIACAVSWVRRSRFGFSDLPACWNLELTGIGHNRAFGQRMGLPVSGRLGHFMSNALRLSLECLDFLELIRCPVETIARERPCAPS